MSGDSDSELGSPIHITALDGIVHVNSLFTFAVFVGLAWNPRDPNNRLTDDPKCQAGPKIGENLVSFHVISFASFLFSSLVSLCLKQALRWPRSESHHALDLAHLNKIVVRVGYVVCAAGSVSGCVCLMLALMNMVQIKLGTLACGSRHSYGAVVPLFTLVPSGLIVYVGFILYAFFSPRS